MASHDGTKLGFLLICLLCLCDSSSSESSIDSAEYGDDSHYYDYVTAYIDDVTTHASTGDDDCGSRLQADMADCLREFNASHAQFAHSTDTVLTHSTLNDICK